MKKQIFSEEKYVWQSSTARGCVGTRREGRGEGTRRKLATATKPEYPIILISQSWTCVTECSSANWGEGHATRREAEKINFQATEHAGLLTDALPRDFLVSAVLQRPSVIDIFLKRVIEQLTLGNHAAMQLWEDRHSPLPGSSLSQYSMSCVAIFSICAIPFRVQV